MRALVALLGSILVLGCSPTSSPSPVTPQPSHSRSERSGDHVLMPLSDLTKELMQHCAAAEKSFNDANRLLMENEKDPSPRKVRNATEALKKGSEDMRRCQQMAHGMHEKHLGEPTSQTPTK